MGKNRPRFFEKSNLIEFYDFRQNRIENRIELAKLESQKLGGGVLAGERGSGRQRVGASADDREASTSAGQHRGLQRLHESVSSDIEDQPRATRRRHQ